MIFVMAWVEPAFSRAQVDAAGRVLTTAPIEASDQFDEEFAVLGNWRASHSFPLNTFQTNLRFKARQVYPSALVAQRLKRVPSILFKLQRFPRMRLTQMQDIGGCRAIVRTVGQVNRLVESYLSTRALHEFVNLKDYIEEPKDSGYRGYHLVYRYRSNSNPSYQSLLVEIQLRTRVQHAWATAVETVGTFVRQALKASKGEPQWIRFFQLASSAFSELEYCPHVPGTPEDFTALRRELSALARDLDVRTVLSAYGTALRESREARRMGDHYFLLSLQPRQKELSVRAYSRDQLAKATADYLEEELRLDVSCGEEAVLVAVESLDALRRSYPNYFLDSQVFLAQLEKVLGASARSPRRLHVKRHHRTPSRGRSSTQASMELQPRRS